MSQIQSSSLRMERRDQDTIGNPPHQIRPRCVYLFLNQFASTRASHVPAYIDERGRRPVYSLRRSKVVGIGRKGKGRRGLRRWGESVRVPFPFPCRAFLPHLLPLLFLCIPRRQVCLFSCLSKDSVTLSKLCPSDTTKKQGYFVLTNFYLHNILFQRNTPLLCEMLAFRGFHRDVQRQSIVQRQQQAV